MNKYNISCLTILIIDSRRRPFFYNNYYIDNYLIILFFSLSMLTLNAASVGAKTVSVFSSEFNFSTSLLSKTKIVSSGTKVCFLYYISILPI